MQQSGHGVPDPLRLTQVNTVAPEVVSSESPQWARLLREPRYAHFARPEQVLRVGNLLSLLPRGRSTALDIGARDGFITAILSDLYPSVTALDLKEPAFEFAGVTTVAGDVRHLDYPDSAFDVVLCAEVLEHVPQPDVACRELARVTRYELVVGVPNWEDTRVGRTTCSRCGVRNPPYGHINRFSLERLESLLQPLTRVNVSCIGDQAAVTNPVSAFLRDLAGNPEGTYDQQEPCVACGATMAPPPYRRARQGVARMADLLDRVQRPFVEARPYWLHVLFAKR